MWMQQSVQAEECGCAGLCAGGTFFEGLGLHLAGDVHHGGVSRLKTAQLLAYVIAGFVAREYCPHKFGLHEGLWMCAQWPASMWHVTLAWLAARMRRWETSEPRHCLEVNTAYLMYQTMGEN